MIRIVALVLIVVSAAASFAQDVVPPRFFIERIEVRNVERVTPDVVVAESRLREGVEYSESELRDAAARLTRLPFLLTAEFALERGTERGRHVLVITVSETRSFFYRFDIVSIYSNSPGIRFDTAAQIGPDETSAALGYRWFLGSKGALHVAVIGRDDTEFTRGYTAFAVGYTLYDLFGTRGFATLNIKRNLDGSRTTPQVVVGMPVTLNQTVTAEYDQDVVDVTGVYFGEPVDLTRAYHLARVTWSYNTTNHPFVPTEGTLVTAGPFATWTDETSVVIGGLPPEVFTTPIHTRTVGVEAGTIRYWPVTDHTSVSAGGELGWARFDARYRSPLTAQNESSGGAFGVLQGRLSRSLWSVERRAQGGDSRVEITVRGRLSVHDIDDELYFAENRKYLQASANWVRHSSWGTLRFGVGYAW